MSFVLKLSGDTSVLRARYFPPIILERECELALISIETWNSIANINSKNNKFYYKVENDLKTIIIPEGSYEITDLEKYIAQELKDDHLKSPLTKDQKLILGEDPIALTGNHSTFKTELLCRYLIDFSQPDNVGTILGFDRVILEPFKRHESTGIIKILLVEALNIECNLTHFQMIKSHMTCILAQ